MHQTHYPHDGNNMYLSELLAVPTVHRCAELGLLIDRCSVKELQHFFPQLVQSIFGNVPGGSGAQIGWGLRTITGLQNAHEFDVLYSFFIPMGPMFRLCYRLLNESIKFEVPIEALPAKTADMLYGGRYAQFYADMINVDPAVRRVTSLSLNAFDYYMLHFALHGMVPLHLMHPAAMDVHNEKRKTLYIFLVADYMCTFLPSHPDTVVMPSNICGTVKLTSAMTPIHQPAMPPARSPKYLKLSALSVFSSTGPSSNPNSSTSGSMATGGHTPAGTPSPHVGGANSSATMLHSFFDAGGTLASPMRNTDGRIITTINAGSANDAGNAHDASGGSASGGGIGGIGANSLRAAWRTESVLHLFVDTWLRCDVTAHLELPSSEFIRAVRICVKQLHAFANAADMDSSPMASLRFAVHPMIGGLTYALLCALIRRWPLDSSFSVVLELWLSYIQPWRYSFQRLHGGVGTAAAVGAVPVPCIERRFEPFVKENMRAYTQILVQLLPRFERLNFASLKNVLMMSRLLKVFAQANLAELLRANEFDVFATVSFMRSSSASPTSPVHHSHQHHHHHQHPGHRSPHQQQHDDGSSSTSSPSATGYVCMFGAEVQHQMRGIGEQMLLARQIELDQAAYLQAECDRRLGGSMWRQWLHWLLVFDEDVAYAQQLADCRKIPELLDGMLLQLVHIFDVVLPELRPLTAAGGMAGTSAGAAMLLDETDHNQSCDMSLSFSESAGASLRPPNSITYTVDPAVIPTKSHEVTFLVRFLYQLSTKLNQMYHREMEECWYRNDLIGRVSRQVLSAPLVVHSFDKSHGVSRVCEQQLTARVNLRPLASYRAVATIVLSFVVGQWWCGVPSFGFIALLLLVFAYVFVLGLFGASG